MSLGSDIRGGQPVGPRPGPFFASRWVTAPAHVRELDPPTQLPAGFRAAGVACGIKPSGNLDLGLLVCDGPQAVSAACFTPSSAPAAPVVLNRERCRLDALRAVTVNAGCANAATGRRGFDDAAKTQGATAVAVGVPPDQVALASTGEIGTYLPMDKVTRGVLGASKALNADGFDDFQRAIETTDAFQKRASLEVMLDAGTVRLCAQCKGAGMISPRFATLLCFVETDAAITPGEADALLRPTVARSFERISVDGQLSTNDTVILMASGASGVRLATGSADYERFAEALEALMRQLAILTVADGEGALRIGRVVVRGGEEGDAEIAARAVANSPLVKAALHGGDANWGRIVQAVGAALPGEKVLAVDIAIEGILVCAGGAALQVDEQVLAQALSGTEIEYQITLPGARAEDPGAEVLFSDLSHEYVTINAEYTT